MEGAFNVKGSSLSIMLSTLIVEILRQAIRSIFLANNEFEYETIIAGLELS